MEQNNKTIYNYSEPVYPVYGCLKYAESAQLMSVKFKINNRTILFVKFSVAF